MIFINKQNIGSEAVYFKITRNGKALYVLINGMYQDKKSAEQARKNFASKNKSSKPWVRSFSEIHGLMSERQ